MCLVQSRQQKSCEIPWIRNITQKMLKLKGSSWALLGKLLDYNMVDSKTVLSQVQELQVILHEIHAEGMFVSESFQVAAIIEKLPPSWKYFKNYLKHKRKEMRLEDLIVRLRIEEDNRSSERAVGNHYMESKANIVDHKRIRGSTLVKAQSKELVGVTLQSLAENALCVARWGIG